MSKISDKYIIAPDIVCIDDIIEFTFIVSNVYDAKVNSLGQTISGGKPLINAKGTFSIGLGGTIDEIVVNKGVVVNNEWTITHLADGEEARATLKFLVTDSCIDEYRAELKLDCLNSCLIKKISPLTCCEVKRCLNEGDLDCTTLIK